MYPSQFEYLAPEDLKQTIELAAQYGPDAKFLAGGQSLVPLMKLRLARPKYLIDLNRLPGLGDVAEKNGRIRCGAMVRHVQLEESELVKRRLPLVSEAAGHIGDSQVRNRGTIGGGLVEADPAGDWGPVVLALNARMECVGPRGERSIDARDFFNFAYTTNLEDDELLTAIEFPLPGDGSAGAYSKLERVAGDFAIVSVAVQLATDEDGRCRAIGIGLGGVGATPLKPAETEAFLVGKTLDSRVIQDACEMLESQVDPISDQRGSADYKRRVVKAVFRRTLMRALGRPERAEASNH
ncbi:MAG: FAD binding domain-containing protein [Candidatus Binatia bacterium]